MPLIQSRRRSSRRLSRSTKDRNSNTIVLGGFATVLLSLFIVFVGFMLAQLCIVILQPECIHRGISSASNSTDISARQSMIITPSQPKVVSEVQSTSTRAPDSAASKSGIILGARSNVAASQTQPPTIPASTLPEFPTTAKFPPQCSSEQLEALSQQLPAEGCLQWAEKAWNFDKCSFSSKTTCGNANPHWFYDFVHQLPKEETFRGIVVGCNKGYEAVELLRIASPPSDSLYDLEKWKEEFSKVEGVSKVLGEVEIDLSIECPADGKAGSNTGASGKKVHVYCIDGMPKTVDQLEKTKKALGYGSELDITRSVIGEQLNENGVPVRIADPIGAMIVGHKHWEKKCKQEPETCTIVPATSIDKFVETKPDLKATNTDVESGLNTGPPIHIMSITAEGSDYPILKGAAQNLGRIQYIDFGYHWNFRWGHYNLKDLIFRLKKKGFVCYFTGSSGEEMWRITDCWQDHYEKKYKASIGCVNANIPAAEPLLDKMEDMFLKTLERK